MAGLARLGGPSSRLSVCSFACAPLSPARRRAQSPGRNLLRARSRSLRCRARLPPHSRNGRHGFIKGCGYSKVTFQGH
eukprot:8802461-Alexandrium_andersonii.AAC.1